MPRKFFALFLAILVAVGCFPAAAFAGEPAEAAWEWVLRQEDAADPQALADGFAKSPGTGEEWLVLALCRGENAAIDFTAYRAALVQALPNIEDPADKLRAALALSAMEYSETAARTAEEAMGERGIMSWIYGLLVLDSRGYASDRRTEAVETLLSLQKADGGWALAGDFGDTDVTAMALQALAPYKENRTVAVAIKNGLGRLASLQNDAGGFASYGSPNAESCAQVLLTLNALGLSYEDELVKNGHTAVDAMLAYQTETGGFSHLAGEMESAMATTQALLALCALRLDAPLYIFETSEHTGLLPPDFAPENPVVSPETPVTSATDLPLPEDATDTVQIVPPDDPPLKHWILLGAALLWLLVLGFHLLRRSGKGKLLTTAALGAILLLVLWFVPIETPAEYNARMAQGHTPVTVTIDCSRAGEPLLADRNLPKDGMLLREMTIFLPENATVYDALQAAAAKTNLAVDTSGLPGSLYVRGIAGLREFDAGELSGWVYRLNGTTMSRSCDAVPVASGDTVVWIYTLELGNDVAP